MSSFCRSCSRVFSSSFENSSHQVNEEEDFHECAQDEEGEPQAQVRDFSQNSTSLTFSWSLMNQLRSMSRVEGVSLETLLIELVSEGVAKRVFEDQNRPAPSHLLTRNGYVHTDEREGPVQPQMSHHMNRQSQNRNNKFHFQSKNGNGQFAQNGKNQMRGNTYPSNNGRAQNNGQGGFRSNGQYNQSSKFNRAQHGNGTAQVRSVPEDDYSNNHDSHPHSKK